MTYNAGPKVSRELYEKSQRTGKQAKRLKGEALELRKTIARVRKSRRSRGKPDPLTFTRIRLLRKIESRRDAAALAYEEDTRKTLITAARIARSMGLDVRSSTAKTGRISSYYARDRHGATIRISDHEIPATAQREFMAQAHGQVCYNGYHGVEVIIDRPRTKTWIRRAITLAVNGRSIY